MVSIKTECLFGKSLPTFFYLRFYYWNFRGILYFELVAEPIFVLINLNSFSYVKSLFRRGTWTWNTFKENHLPFRIPSKKKAVQTNDKVYHDFDRRLHKNLKGKWRYRTNKRTNQRKKIFLLYFFWGPLSFFFCLFDSEFCCVLFAFMKIHQNQNLELVFTAWKNYVEKKISFTFARTKGKNFEKVYYSAFSSHPENKNFYLILICSLITHKEKQYIFFPHLFQPLSQTPFHKFFLFFLTFFHSDYFERQSFVNYVTKFSFDV